MTVTAAGPGLARRRPTVSSSQPLAPVGAGGGRGPPGVAGLSAQVVQVDVVGYDAVSYPSHEPPSIMIRVCQPRPGAGPDWLAHPRGPVAAGPPGLRALF